MSVAFKKGGIIDQGGKNISQNKHSGTARNHWLAIKEARRQVRKQGVPAGKKGHSTFHFKKKVRSFRRVKEGVEQNNAVDFLFL